MADYPNYCKLCSKRIQAHDRSARCTTCNISWHVNCLPNYSPLDIEYAKHPNNNWSCPPCLKDFFPFYEIECNDAFLNTTANPIPNLLFNIEELEAMVFDPFDSADTDADGVFSDIDPDHNFLGHIRGNAINNSKYYYSSNQMEELANNNNPHNITYLHLNIRSIPTNQDTFTATLHASNMKPDLIGFSETWLTPSNADCYTMPGYNHEFLTRENKLGGVYPCSVMKIGPIKYAKI
jgi:hypothetical protein